MNDELKDFFKWFGPFLGIVAFITGCANLRQLIDLGNQLFSNADESASHRTPASAKIWDITPIYTSGRVTYHIRMDTKGVSQGKVNVYVSYDKTSIQIYDTSNNSSNKLASSDWQRFYWPKW